MADIWKFWLAAALVTIGIHYLSEGVEKVKEVVLAKHQNDPHQTKK